MNMAGLLNQKQAAKTAAAIKQPSYLLRWFLQYYQLVTVAACVLFMILGYFLLLSPKLTRARTMEAAKLTAEQERQSALELKLQYLAALANQRAETSDADVQKISSMLPSGPAVPELLSSLEGIARASQVTMEGVEISLIEEVKVKGKNKEKTSAQDSLPAGVRAIEATVGVSAAPYANLKTFLTNIEASLRLMDVVALLYNPAAKSYTITVRTYYLP